MFRLYTFLVTFFVAAAFIFADPQYYNYNNGTSFNSFPFNQGAGKRIQTYIAPGEFTTPSPAPNGSITKFSVRIATGYPLGPVTYTNFRIIFSDTTLSGNTMEAGWYLHPNEDTVFFRASLGPISAGADTWLDFTLDHPHPYNNTKGLVVAIEQQAASGSFSGFSLQHTTTPTYRRHYSVGGSPFTYSGRSLYVPNCGIDIASAPTCNFTWAAQTSGTTSLLYSVKAVSDLVAWTAGAAATVRRTTDGGANWTNGNPNPGVITGDIYNIEAIDANTAWVTTSPSATNIYRTTNGGTNWTLVYTATGFINAIKMQSASVGIATGDPVSSVWVILATTNGGVNWTPLPTAPASVSGEDGRNNSLQVSLPYIWFGTGQGKIYRSTNAGVNWTAVATTGLTGQVLSVHFNSLTSGLGGGATMVRSTDAGATYALLPASGTGNINGIQGTGSNYWYCRGTGIFRSTNGGDAWTQVHTAVGTQNHLSFATGSNGCLVGWSVASGGNIAKMTGTPVGISNNNNQIPDNYVLSQNYPNPFNPMTTIQFGLPDAGKTSLVVYDVLGRIVAAIVNDFRSAGTYSVNFDGTNLSSGIYFYTLESGSFKETKKMMIVK